MADQKLTQRNAITETADDSLIHVVAGGSSYKTTKANFLSNVPGYSPNNVSAVWTGTGNIFDVTADSYQVDGNTYSSAPGQVTLDVSDPILDRIDLIIAIAPVSPDTIGTVGKITGTPATLDLVVPPDYDPALVFPIKQVTIKANSGVPFQTTKEIVFNEGTEWTYTPLASVFTLVTNDPYTGTKSIYANGATIPDKLKFTSATAFNTQNVDLLEFYIKSDNVSFDYINLVCQFQLAGSLVGRVGTWITDPQPNDWNRVQINKQQLALLPGNYDELVFYCSSPSGGANFWIDNIAIFEGSGADNANLNISQFINDVPYLRTGSNISELVNDAGYLTNYIADKICYIDAVDGDDLTGELSNIDKPFKTDVGAFNALPAWEGYSFFWTFKWIRTAGYNSPITITPHNLTRGIRYECDVTGKFEIDYQSNTYKEIWFDMPMCTITHNNGLGGTYSPVTLEYNAVSRKVAYINCQNYYNDSSRNFFILGTLHCQVIIQNAYTSGPFLSDGTIRIANWDLNAGNMFDSGQGDKINIEIQNLTLNGQVVQLGLVSPSTLPKFPFKKILGTGGISTSNIRNADVTDLSVASGITIHHASPSILTGTMGEEFDGSVRYYNQAKIRNYNGYINGISGSNAYGIGYDIEDSIIKLTGGLISGNPSFNWVDTVWNWKNVTFVSDNPASTLISNYNALTLVTINAYGNISSNIGLSAISGLTYVNHTLEQNPRITDIGVATTYDFDHELATDWKLTMTADTTFTESNLPIRNNTIEYTFKLTGAFTPTFPSYWTVLGDAYDGDIFNFFAVQVHNGNSGSEEVTVFITNIE